MTAKEATDIAKSQIGVKETPPNSNNVIYNTWYYGHPVSGSAYPWCAVFISWIFRNTNLVMKTASSSSMYTSFKNKGQIFSKPKVGDIVFFKFDKSLSCIAQHVGIVAEVLSNGKIKSIEGNTSSGNSGSQDNGGMVALRTRSASQIVGYGRPAYSDSPAKHRPTIMEGDKGQDVKDLQNALRDLHYGCQASGIFDKVTRQCTEHYQITHALEPDGIVGPKTWQSLGMYYY